MHTHTRCIDIESRVRRASRPAIMCRLGSDLCVCVSFLECTHTHHWQMCAQAGEFLTHACTYTIPFVYTHTNIIHVLIYKVICLCLVYHLYVDKFDCARSLCCGIELHTHAHTLDMRGICVRTTMHVRARVERALRPGRRAISPTFESCARSVPSRFRTRTPDMKGMNGFLLDVKRCQRVCVCVHSRTRVKLKLAL